MTESDDDLRSIQNNLERMNRLYAMLSRINRTIVRADDPHDLYTAACRIAVEQGGFNLAWIGLVEPGSRRVVPVGSAGLAAAELEGAADSAGESAEGQGLAGHAIRQERPFIVDDIAADPPMAPWGAMTERWGVRSGGSFPLRLEGRVIGVFTVAAGEAGFFREMEIRLLTEVADDISFALDVMRREEKRIAMETKVRYLAYYDAQTGMPSRTLFEERLAYACAQAEGKSMAVLVASLRNYHGVLQLMGPLASLEIVRTLAARLESAFVAAPVARITESKFAILLLDPGGLHLVEEFAWRIHRVLADAIRTEGQEVFLDPFIGIALHPRDGNPAEVLRHALVAAGAAPNDAISVCRFYSPDLEQRSRRRLDLDAALHRALERSEFVLHYQPQVDLASGCVIGAEALLRWQRPEHGLVPPLDFIPLLEDTGLIGAVGEWALHEACQAGRRWQDEGIPPFRMAVNLSARQFHNGDIRVMVRKALDASGLDPQWLELELTESIVMRNAESVIRTMRDLNADGISLALDDFGTGYASLSYLQRLPVARIKIDQSFVANVTTSPSDAAIARAVVGMAHSLGLGVIAEGVETIGQLGYLRGLDVEEIQGYYFSRPLPADEFAALLREGRCIAPSASPKPERVLLVLDDEPNILTALTRLLRRDGYRVLSTNSPGEAFDLLAAHPVGVVLCDQRLPEMTGTEFLRRVKDLHPDVVRIVLSGYTELNSVIDAVNRGAVYKFLTKPWEDDALTENLREAFRFYEMGRENRELSHRVKELMAAGATLQ